MRSGKPNAITGPFIIIRHEVKTSPAWRALPDNARRFLDRLEIEHMDHGRSENGNLICTYSDFQKAGIRRASIALAKEQCEALGFLKVTETGRRAAAEFRAPSRYRLTYVHGVRKNPDPTDEWKSIKDDAQAKLALAEVRMRRELAKKPKIAVDLRCAAHSLRRPMTARFASGSTTGNELHRASGRDHKTKPPLTPNIEGGRGSAPRTWPTVVAETQPGNVSAGSDSDPTEQDENATGNLRRGGEAA